MTANSHLSCNFSKNWLIHSHGRATQSSAVIFYLYIRQVALLNHSVHIATLLLSTSTGYTWLRGHLSNSWALVMFTYDRLYKQKLSNTSPNRLVAISFACQNCFKQNWTIFIRQVFDD